MDFETWLAAPHPPPELLMSIALIGQPGKIEDLDPFAAASPEGAAWVAFLKGTPGCYDILAELPEYYEAKAESAKWEAMFRESNDSILFATVQLSMLEGMKRDLVKVPDGDFYDAVREKVDCLARKLESEIEKVMAKLKRHKREDKRLYRSWIDAVKRLGAAENSIREFL